MLSFLKKIFNPERPDLEALLAEGALVIDVRTPDEFNSGHPKGAINIPVNKIEKHFQKLHKEKRPIITCCASGMRSKVARNKLRGNGFTDVHNGGPWQRVAEAQE